EEPAARGIEKMIMHPHQSRQSGIAGEINAVRSGWNLHRTGIAKRSYLSPGDHDGLIGFSGSAGTVNHADMLKCGHRRIYPGELFYFGSRLGLGSRKHGTAHNEQDNKSSAHSFTFLENPEA